MIVTLIPRDEIQFVWPLVEPLLKKAVSRTKGRWEVEDVFIDLLKGKQTLWVGFESDIQKDLKWCSTITVFSYPGCRVACMQYLAGNGFFEWVEEGFNVLKEYAREQHCDRFEMFGRKGFEETIKKLGGKTLTYQYDFDLKE